MDGGHPGRLGSGLSVRLVHTDEVARFNALLDEHHWLGHHLFGRVLRYVATYDGEWVALVGFGSAALSVAGRDRFIGWSPATKRRHLRYVANNQRYVRHEVARGEWTRRKEGRPMTPAASPVPTRTCAAGEGGVRSSWENGSPSQCSKAT